MSGDRRSTGARSSTASGSRRAQNTTTLSTGCVNPIRLRGFYQRIAAETGEVLTLFGSPETADGILLVSCKDRRASCCPPCARLYQRDAYQLIAAGLLGGKTVPASVVSHPAVMLTLTAPSFGAVHGNRDRGRTCKCGLRHEARDPQIGTPIDSGHYRYADQVAWNHYAPELWKRTVQAFRRGLAHALGVPRSKLAQVALVRFAKVAEFQQRGVVHYHAIIRIDGPEGADSPPPAQCTTTLLAQIGEAAIEGAAVVPPDRLLDELAPAAAGRLRWGAQHEIVALDHHTCTKAAGYIAKYATKATETATGGTVIKPIRSQRHLDELRLSEHARALITTAWAIGKRTGIEGFKRWAHQFGYGGHTLTKSRQYSVTFQALRAARIVWRRTGNGEGEVVVRAHLAYAGRGPGHSRTFVLPSGDRQPRPPARSRSQA
jgi:hypothetical protein